MDTDFTYVIQDALHTVSQVLLVPVMIILLLLIAISLYNIGSLIAEYFSEHKHLTEKLSTLMDKIENNPLSSLPETIQNSGLLRRQRKAVCEVLNHAHLPLDDLLALARKLSHDEEDHYGKVLSRTDFLAKIGPMFGLMGTLIPLGPGIVALGSGNTETLSNALLVAFDTTTAGLIAAALALFVSRIRRRWYANYSVMLDAVLTAVLKKIKDATPEQKQALADSLNEQDKNAENAKNKEKDKSKNKDKDKENAQTSQGLQGNEGNEHNVQSGKDTYNAQDADVQGAKNIPLSGAQEPLGPNDKEKVSNISHDTQTQREAEHNANSI